MFTPGLYNAQKSSYVGSTLGEYMNLLPYAQQRYDVARDTLDETDAFINSVDHLEGDRDALYQITSPYREGLAAARESGDYRGMYDQIRGLGKKVVSDKGIKTIQESYAGARRQEELEAQYGTRALSFSDPSKHRSIQVDERGNVKYDVYTPHVEQRGDYDKRIQDIWSILKADGMPINLREHTGAIKGFLESGSWEGISGKKVQEYLGQAFDRYIESPEGEQDYRRLTQIEGYTPEEAVNDINRRMLSVGSGMVYSKTDMRYQQDPLAEAKAAAAAKQAGAMGGETGYIPASKATTARLGDLIGTTGKLERNEKGELVKQFNWGETWTENYNAAITNSAYGLGPGKLFGEPMIFSKVTDFVGATLLTAFEGITGSKKSKFEPTGAKKVHYNNMLQSAANEMTNGDVSKLTARDIEGYVNLHMDDEIGLSAPTQTFDKEQYDAFKKTYISEPVKNKDGDIIGVMPKSFASKRFFFAGEPMSYTRLFGEKGRLGIPAQFEVTESFGPNNSYGFVNGGYVAQVMTQEGEIFNIPMEGSVANAYDEDKVETMMYETGYVPLTRSSINPQSVFGYERTAISRDNRTGSYRLYSLDNPDIPIATISPDEDFAEIFKSDPDPAFRGKSLDEIKATTSHTLEAIMARALSIKSQNVRR